MRIADDIRRAVHDAGHPDVDHVELYGPPLAAGANSRNFVLCPSRHLRPLAVRHRHQRQGGGLAADGALAEGETWVQESITGSTFEITYRWHDREEASVVPTLTGTAVVTGQAELLIHPDEQD